MSSYQIVLNSAPTSNEGQIALTFSSLLPHLVVEPSSLQLKVRLLHERDVTVKLDGSAGNLEKGVVLLAVKAGEKQYDVNPKLPHLTVDIPAFKAGQPKLNVRLSGDIATALKLRRLTTRQDSTAFQNIESAESFDVIISPDREMHGYYAGYLEVAPSTENVIINGKKTALRVPVRITVVPK